MRIRRTALLLVLVPALAAAQGRDRDVSPAPTGRLLLAACPERADLVVHTPDLPRLLASAEAEGLGDGTAWRAAFRRQMTVWGARTGAPELLTRGAERLLRAADGEALLASLPLPPFEGPSRATLLAFRSSAREGALREALGQVFEGGLITAYPAAPRDEQIGGRPVVAFSDVHDRLFVLVQDGLVAASDHPLALGLLFRGLERMDEPEPAGELLLEVRHGRGDAAWTGWTYGARESVSWMTRAAVPLSGPLPAGLEPVVAVALARAADAPLLPQPAPDWLQSVAGPAGARLVTLTRSGHVVVSGAGEPVRDPGLTVSALAGGWAAAADPSALEPVSAEAAPEVLAGGASRLGWLRAWANGRLAPPLPGLEREALLGPLASAAEASAGKAPFLPWSTPDRSGELRGPRWHGPTTMLALRTLRDIAAKSAPGVARRVERPAPKPPGTGVSLPPPVTPREGGDDGR